MLLFGFYLLSCLSVCALGCHSAENGRGATAGTATGTAAGTVAPATTSGPTTPPTEPRFETHHEPEANIWLGEMEFVSLFCGTGVTMPSIIGGIGTSLRGIGQSIGGIFRRQRRQVADGQAPGDINDLTAEELEKYKLDHSVMYFRGQAYEWGNGMLLPSFVNGTVNRNSAECGTSIRWTLQGRSSCTFDQMSNMAHSYLDMFGAYSVITNNCHHYVERMIQKLLNGQCQPFFVNP